MEDSPFSVIDAFVFIKILNFLPLDELWNSRLVCSQFHYFSQVCTRKCLISPRTQNDEWVVFHNGMQHFFESKLISKTLFGYFSTIVAEKGIQFGILNKRKTVEMFIIDCFGNTYKIFKVSKMKKIDLVKHAYDHTSLFYCPFSETLHWHLTFKNSNKLISFHVYFDMMHFRISTKFVINPREEIMENECALTIFFAPLDKFSQFSEWFKFKYQTALFRLGCFPQGETIFNNMCCKFYIRIKLLENTLKIVFMHHFFSGFGKNRRLMPFWVLKCKDRQPGSAPTFSYHFFYIESNSFRYQLIEQSINNYFITWDKHHHLEFYLRQFTTPPLNLDKKWMLPSQICNKIE